MYICPKEKNKKVDYEKTITNFKDYYDVYFATV